jgi:hypothetical protein
MRASSSRLNSEPSGCIWELSSKREVALLASQILISDDGKGPARGARNVRPSMPKKDTACRVEK